MSENGGKYMKKDGIIEIVLVALGIVLTFVLMGVILFSSGK
jgi:flagellar basal body-associated protein FliL